MSLSSYAVLAPVSRGCPPPLDTFLRVTHPSAAADRSRPRDLHVLSMPPAFALSQDQTLRFIHHQAKTQQLRTTPHSSQSPNNSQPSPGTTRHQAQPPKASAPLSTNTRAPTAHPTPRKAQSPHDPSRTPNLPAQHPAIPTKEQPRTKHFQNRCNCQRTTPDQPETTSGEASSRQSS